jgi:hypothetical protein
MGIEEFLNMLNKPTSDYTNVLVSVAYGYNISANFDPSTMPTKERVLHFLTSEFEIKNAEVIDDLIVVIYDDGNYQGIFDIHLNNENGSIMLSA